jgi:hypothetical protein
VFAVVECFDVLSGVQSLYLTSDLSFAFQMMQMRKMMMKMKTAPCQRKEKRIRPQ